AGAGLKARRLDGEAGGAPDVFGVAVARGGFDRAPIGREIVEPLPKLAVGVAQQHIEGRIHVGVGIDHAKAQSHGALRCRDTITRFDHRRASAGGAPAPPRPAARTAACYGSAGPFAHPAFALLWCSRVLSNVAFNMLGVAVGWQLYDLTGSALDLGLVGLAQFAPIVLLTLIVGQVADRYDRRLVASICQFAQAAAAAALVAGTVSGRLASAGIFATVALVGGARAFEGPTSTALISDVVARPLISRAMAWLMAAAQTARIVGPALGGFLYAVGPATTYATAAALFLAASACAAVIPARRGSRTSEAVVLERVLSGLVFIRNQPVLLGVMSLDMFAVLFGGGATALLPIYARDILSPGPARARVLRSAPAVGAL